jgi:hypothetical protein
MTFAEAQRAIYVDFECLKATAAKPPHPALLGVLVGSGGEEFGQIITDERLAPAKVANKNCRVGSASTAAAALVAQAKAGNRKIVGWSFFDRDRLIEACPDRKADINLLYVNALHVARPWRKTIHPGFPIEREDQFAPKHTLDKYAALAGYAHLSGLQQAQPAKWIRHTLDQLKATKGRYRQTTTQTKRDWHKLLEYNRHDCLALRHIVLKATREMECWRAYETTRFCVDDGARRVCFTQGSPSPRLQALLRRHDAVRWAFLTAWNPASVELSRADNDARQDDLKRDLVSSGYRWLPGEGVGVDPECQPEESLLVLGISGGKAVAVGRDFGQLAVVVGRRDGPARLVPCAPTPALRTPRRRVKPS